MSEQNLHEVSQLLLAWSEGDRAALDRLVPLVYAELRRLAKSYMRRERAGQTMQTTALIHEAYLRLIDADHVRLENRAHFFAAAARVMRQVLVDLARERGSRKRGGEARRVQLDEAMAVAEVAGTIAGPGSAADIVIADTAPTGHALRLLQTPAVLRDWALALMAILLKYREIVGAGTLASLLVQLSKRLRALQDILADAAQSRFVVVTRAAMVPVAESLELIQALRPVGVRVDTVIVNAVGRGDCTLCRAVAADQRRAIARLGAAVAADGYAIIEAPAEIPPPHGVAALSEWRRAWRQHP